MTDKTYIQFVEVLTAFFKERHRDKSIILIFYSPSLRCTKTSKRQRSFQLSMVFRLKVKTKETQISPSPTEKHQSLQDRVAHSTSS